MITDKKRSLWAGLAAKRKFLFVLSIPLIMVLWYELQPHYGGRTLYHWLNVLGDREPGVENWHAATNAVNHIGAAAVPALLRRLQSDGQEDMDSALIGFRILGSRASNAIPELTELLLEHKCGDLPNLAIENMKKPLELDSPSFP